MTNYAFPATISAFNVALPLPALGAGISEVEFEFERTEYRQYAGAAPPDMYAATYTAPFVLAPHPGTLSFGVLKSVETGKVIQSVELIAKAFAQYHSLLKQL